MADTERLVAARRVSYMDAVVEAIAQEMRCDDRVVLIGQDVGRFGGHERIQVLSSDGRLIDEWRGTHR